MVAGQGITHSERMDDPAQAAPHRLFGLQTWLALPLAQEDRPAGFIHAPRDSLPGWTAKASVSACLGDAWGARAPVDVPHPMFYADAVLEPGAVIPLPEEHEDRGVFVLSGAVSVAGEVFAAGKMMVFRQGDRLGLTAGPEGARIMLLGGAVMDGPRHIWWNFVASSKERIEAAKEAWRPGISRMAGSACPPETMPSISRCRDENIGGGA